MNILFVDVCVRGEISNTRKLCQAALETLETRYPQAQVERVDLNALRPEPLHPEYAQERSALHAANAFENPIYDFARQFAAADLIVIGAPYWDLSFPAVLKIYLERVCAVGVTFAYNADGSPYSLCKAEKLLYVSTAGGPVGEEYNLGFDYIRGLCEVFFGIKQLGCYLLDGLDAAEDPRPLVEKAERELRDMLREW